MTRILSRLLVAATLVLAAGLANAAAVTYTGVANSVDRGGVYAGFYTLTLDGEAILGLCDSRDSVVNPPSAWTADVLTYADIQGGAIGKFNTPLNTVKYSQAGWLFSELGSLAPNDYSGQADIQEAIWKVMTPGYALVGGGAGAYYTAATGGTHDAFDWSGIMRVITPDPLVQNSYDIQEFLVGPAPAVVPVPAAVWLFGSALGALGAARRRRVSLA